MSERKQIIPQYGPFAGMRVIDSGSLIAMPYAATLLADFGAEVIHIERPGVGDTLRVLAPFAKEDGKTVSTSWAQDGRNKLSLSLELNLKHPEVKELFFGLIKEADVFMENMVWLEKLGIRDEELLEVNPKLIIADECISALDVSIQAQVVNMFEELQDKLGVAYLFIAHDLLVVHHISDRIAVMYLGKMMEIADADELNGNPMHPYTLSLLSAVPIPDPETARKSHRIVLEGDVPSPLKMPTGCPFRTRCKYATEKCGQEMPQLTDRGNGHMVACWNK